MSLADIVSPSPSCLYVQSLVNILPLSRFSRCIQAKQYPRVPIYGGSEEVKFATEIVKDADAFTVGSLEVK